MTTTPSWLRWLAGLSLPAALLALCAAGLFWYEYKTRLPGARLGAYLLRHNRERPERGALWQGILASRRSRSRVGVSAGALAPESLPPVLLRAHYELDRGSADFLVLRVRSRTTPLQAGRISGAQMQSLALSLQVYNQGEALLAAARLPGESFRVQARIRAEVALEDGSLFPLLHRRLRRLNAPEAWSFVRMAPAEQAYWRRTLGAFLAAPPDSASPTPVTRVCAALVRTWEDSLRRSELLRLRRAWREGSSFEIRLLRNMDRFAGYALTPGELPVQFTLPAARAAAILGLREEDAP